MKKNLSKFFLIASVGVVLLAAGCNLIEPPDLQSHKAKVVLRERFCVAFDENRTSGEFESEVVCDQLVEEVRQWLVDNAIDGDDIKHIFMMGGVILEGGEFEGAHRWDVTSSVYIERTDIDDGPRRLLKPQTVTVPTDIEGPKGYKPKFDKKGVKLVNRALRDFVDGGLPELVLTMVSTDVDPEPSELDPMVFSWQPCVDVMAILQRGGGHGGDDDDDDDSESADSDGDGGDDDDDDSDDSDDRDGDSSDDRDSDSDDSDDRDGGSSDDDSESSDSEDGDSGGGRRP